jgi:hypothetical protein
VFDRYAIVTEADLRVALGRLAEPTGTRKGQSTDPAGVAAFGRRRM